MIDKLDIRVPAGTPFAPEVQRSLAELRYGPVAPFRPSRFYQYVGDLRQTHDIDAVLHLNYRFGEPSHKLEIVDAGKKTLVKMVEIASRIFEVDPYTLSLMRLDLAADIPHIPVNWFRDNARFLRKRFASRIEKAMKPELEFIAMGSADAQSLYAGRRPNCMRIYDKFAEWLRQWLRMKRGYERFNRGMQDFEMTDEQNYFGQRIPPSFEEFCRNEGYEYKPGAILTRVERQIGGDRFPKQVRTVADLRNVDEFNPFDGLRILGSEMVRCMPVAPPVSGLKLLAVRGLMGFIQDFGGMQPALAYITRNSNGNGKRVLDSVMPYLPGERPAVNERDVYKSYRESTKRQLPAHLTDAIYLPPTYGQAKEIAEQVT